MYELQVTVNGEPRVIATAPDGDGIMAVLVNDGWGWKIQRLKLTALVLEFEETETEVRKLKGLVMGWGDGKIVFPENTASLSDAGRNNENN